jgi:uncharacterized membrane protein YhaH (DUF805 family)
MSGPRPSHGSPPPEEPTGPPPNPRAGRQRFLIGALRAAVALVTVAAAMSTVLGGKVAERLSVVLVGLLVAAPAGRVAWLLVRWARLGDRRFTGVAGALLGVMALGAVLAR